MRLQLLLLTTVAILIGGAAGQSAGCNYNQAIAAGQTLQVFSPNYQQNYTGGVNCRWEAVAPSTSILILTCNDFNLPPSNNCVEDRFRVSPTGDATMSDAHTYCGFGTISLTSTNNRMVITLTAPYYSRGGRFMCTLTANIPTTPKPSSCDCGWRNQARIVNGKETGVNEFPMMAAVVAFELGEIICGTTIISNCYSVSAAHCLLNRQEANTGVLVGDHDISTGYETNSAKVLRVEKFLPYPTYNSATQQDDIAVIRAECIIFSLKVGPACLPVNYPTTPVGTLVYVLGWGTLEYTGPKSDRLMGTQLSIVDISNCQQVFGSKVSPTKNLCTFRSGTDACQADSGGPLLLTGYGNNRLQLVGIISYGKGCATQYPGVNTHVYPYISWIKSVTPDAKYCEL